MELTQEQYEKVLKADNTPINYEAIKQFIKEVNEIKGNLQVYELS